MSKRSTYIALVFAMMLWGLSWTNAKILGTYLDPPLLMTCRMFIGTIALIPILPFLNGAIVPVKESYLFILFNGLFVFVYNYFYFKGTQIGQAGIGGVIVTTLNPQLTFLFTMIINKTKPLRKDLIGLGLGLLGGLTILQLWQFRTINLFQSGNIYFLLCALFWSIVTMITTKATKGNNTIVMSFWTFFVAGIFSYLFSYGKPLGSVLSFDFIFWLNLLLLGIGSMSIATTLYFLGTKNLGPDKASSFVMIVPMTALFFSMIFLGEKLNIFTLTGSFLAIGSVYLINKKPTRSTVEVQ